MPIGVGPQALGCSRGELLVTDASCEAADLLSGQTSEHESSTPRGVREQPLPALTETTEAVRAHGQDHQDLVGP
jgi:hypothetical protein